MKVFTSCVAAFFFAFTAKPCIWVTETKYNGESISVSGMSGAKLLRHFLRTNRKPDGVRMETELRGATNFSARSDYAVALMYLGRAPEAVELLQRLESEKPGEYFIAANLGTALELSGQNEEALQWINEGIHRNPDSHEGTEWLHAKILETKIAQQKDAGYFKKHSVLELRPEAIGEGINVGQQRLSAKELLAAIQFQLTERLQFVKPPDPAVASLLFDYAAIETQTRTVESAKSVLQLAMEYGYPAEKVTPLMKFHDQRIVWRKTKQYGFYGLIGVGAVALLYFLYRRGIFVLSSRHLKRAR